MINIFFVGGLGLFLGGGVGVASLLWMYILLRSALLVSDHNCHVRGREYERLCKDCALLITEPSGQHLIKP